MADQRPRRSRQVRSASRRSLTRVLERGASRATALRQFHRHGGKLTADELQYLAAILLKKPTKRARKEMKRLGIEFGGYGVVRRQAASATVAIDGFGEFHVTPDGGLGERIGPGERAARSAGWTDEQIDQVRQAGHLYPDAVLAVERGKLSGLEHTIADFHAQHERACAVNFDVEQREIRLDYVALMPDGSLETVAGGQVIYRSQPDPALLESLRREAPGGLPSPGDAIAEYNAMVEAESERLLHPALRDLRDRLLFRDNPPNDAWPVRTNDAVRPGCYACVIASSLNPQWEEIVDWLAQCPPLTDIETFWLFEPDPRYSNHGWQLWITAVERKPKADPEFRWLDQEAIDMEGSEP